MELVGILRELWQRKVWVAVVAGLAVLAAAMTSYKLPSFEKRSLQMGAASSQILVDSPKSTLVSGADDGTLTTLSARARIYAQYLSSLEARDQIAKLSGVPARTISVSGPFSPDANRTNYEPQGSTQRTDQLIKEDSRNRLVFAAQEGVPIITVNSQAGTSRTAVKLASASFTTLERYVETLDRERGKPLLQENGKPFPADGAKVRELGAPEGGTIGGGNNKLVMIFTFLAVFVVGCIVIVVAPTLSRQWRVLDEVERLTKAGPTLNGNGNGNGHVQPSLVDEVHPERVLVPGKAGSGNGNGNGARTSNGIRSTAAENGNGHGSEADVAREPRTSSRSS
jgi:hypothetical protein